MDQSLDQRSTAGDRREPDRGSPPGAAFDASDDAGLDELFETVLGLADLGDCRSFFIDLCTPAELRSLRDRWRVARLIAQGFPYREIHDLSGVSTATITRVGRALSYGAGGYLAQLERRRRAARARSRRGRTTAANRAASRGASRGAAAGRKSEGAGSRPGKNPGRQRVRTGSKTAKAPRRRRA